MHLHVVFSSCDGAEYALLRASVRRRCDPSFVVARVRFVQKDRRHSLSDLARCTVVGPGLQVCPKLPSIRHEFYQNNPQTLSPNQKTFRKDVGMRMNNGRQSAYVTALERMRDVRARRQDQRASISCANLSNQRIYTNIIILFK